VALTSADAHGKRVAAAVTALALVVAINLLAIPTFGLVAPVAGAIAAAMAIGSLYALFVRRQFGSVGVDAPVLIGTAAASAIGALAGLAVRAAGPEPWAPLLAGVAGLVAYGLVALAGPGRPMLRAWQRSGLVGG
jgi:hypothetical protein